MVTVAFSVDKITTNCLFNVSHIWILESVIINPSNNGFQETGRSFQSFSSPLQILRNFFQVSRAYLYINHHKMFTQICDFLRIREVGLQRCEEETYVGL